MDTVGLLKKGGFYLHFLKGQYSQHLLVCLLYHMDLPWALVMFFCHKDKKSRGGLSADKQEEEKIRVGGKTPTMGNWMLMAFKFQLQPFPSQHASCLQELGDTRYSQTSLYFQLVALNKCCFVSKIIIIRKCSVNNDGFIFIKSSSEQCLRLCFFAQCFCINIQILTFQVETNIHRL